MDIFLVVVVIFLTATWINKFFESSKIHQHCLFELFQAHAKFCRQTVQKNVYVSIYPETVCAYCIFCCCCSSFSWTLSGSTIYEEWGRKSNCMRSLTDANRVDVYIWTNNPHTSSYIYIYSTDTFTKKWIELNETENRTTLLYVPINSFRLECKCCFMCTRVYVCECVFSSNWMENLHWISHKSTIYNLRRKSFITWNRRWVFL